MATRSELYDLYANDWQALDKVETVTFTTVQGEEVATAKAKRLGPDKPARSASGQFGHQPAMVRWRLFDNTLDGHEPHQRCTITDEDGVVFTIETAGRGYYDTQWDCSCVRQVS
jgi:hypothetical protein